jgi:hypothetical protein
LITSPALVPIRILLPSLPVIVDMDAPLWIF